MHQHWPHPTTFFEWSPSFQEAHPSLLPPRSSGEEAHAFLMGFGGPSACVRGGRCPPAGEEGHPLQETGGTWTVVIGDQAVSLTRGGRPPEHLRDFCHHFGGCTLANDLVRIAGALNTMKVHDGALQCVALSTHGDVLVSGVDSTVRIWHATSGAGCYHGRALGLGMGTWAGRVHYKPRNANTGLLMMVCPVQSLS